MHTCTRLRDALAPFAALALFGAVSCGTQPDETKAEPEAVAAAVAVPSPLLRYETVRAILEDSKGNTWFGSWNEGACRFDGKGLTYFTVDDGLTNNQIRSIREDRNGVVWFEGGVGLSGFDGTKIVAPTKKDYASKDEWLLQPGDVWFKEDGSVGATAIEECPGVYRYDGETLTYLTFPPPADASNLTTYANTGMSQGKDGRVWFATYGAVFGYDGKSFNVFDDARLGLDDSTGRLHVRCVFEDSKGNLWIGNNGIGVILHDGATSRRFTQEMGVGQADWRVGRTTALPGDVTEGAPSMHRVFSMGEDRDGNIWFGTVEDGAWRYDGKTLRNFTAADGLTSKDIFVIYTDRRGDLWLGGHGVFKFNGTTFDRVH